MHQPAQLLTRGGDPVMFQGLRVSGVLQGLLFEATVEQRFLNPTDQHVEVIYTFPLPWGAVLLEVQVQLGDQHLTGAVVEKQSAAAQYEAALAEGNAAILLERNPDGSHGLNLGNLAPGETCLIRLRYAQTLAFEQQGLRLLMPTVIAPRYGDPVRDGGWQPQQTVEHDLTTAYPFALSLTLKGALARARVASPSHPIGVSVAAADPDLQLTVSLTQPATLDRDFILVVDQLQTRALAVQARDAVNPERVTTLLSFCLPIPATAVPALSVKLLVDCSGSMAGDSLAAAQRALLATLQNLGPLDRFSLSRFGSTVEHRSRGLWRANEITRLTALQWVDHLAADLGGTEMAAALSSTLQLARQIPSDVLLVTDGEIEGIDSLICLAQASGQRLFVVGIGSSPAEGHLRRLAAATGGACDFVAPGEAVQPAILRMFARLRSPRLMNLRLEWPAEITPGWVSPLPSAVFAGDAVPLFADLPAPLQGTVRLWGQRAADQAPEVLGAVQVTPDVATGDGLSRMAALARLEGLTGAPAVTLASAYRLVTDYTHCLLIHTRDTTDQAEAMPELHKVKQMMPAGWAGLGTVVDAPDIPRFSRRQSPTLASQPNPLALDYPDIPASLRRQAPPSEPAPSRRREVDAQGYLTPWGLLDRLRNATPETWPHTYVELRQWGLRSELVDWLEYCLADEYWELKAERMVVDSFLYALLQGDHYQVIMQSAGFLQGLKAKWAQTLTQGRQASQLQTDPDLLEDLASYLEGVTAACWPASMGGPPEAMAIEEEA